MRPSRFGLVCSLSLVALLSACASGPGSGAHGLAKRTALHQPLPQVVDDCEHLALRPRKITVACGDGNYLLTGAEYDA